MVLRAAKVLVKMEESAAWPPATVSVPEALEEIPAKYQQVIYC